MPQKITSPHELEFTLADRLRKSLSAAETSVNGMASELGVSRQSVTRWINDQGRPTMSTLIAWSTITGAPLEWLLGQVDQADVA